MTPGLATTPCRPRFYSMIQITLDRLKFRCMSHFQRLSGERASSDDWNRHSVYRVMMHSCDQKFTLKVTHRPCHDVRCNWLSRVGCAQFGLTPADQNTQFERAPRAKRGSPKDRWKVLTTPRFYNVLSFDQPLIDFFHLSRN